jgi:chemotaxis protein MotD
MMPGIAIQPGFSIPAAPAARAVSAPADDGFSKALREKPSAPAQADGKADPVDDDSGDAGGTAVHGKDGKVGSTPHAKDGHEDHDDDGDAKKDDDKESGALPPQMTAQRVIAGQWQVAAPTAQDGADTGDAPPAPPGAAAPATQGAGTAQANGATIVAAQATPDTAGAAVAQAAPDMAGGSAAAQSAVAAALQAPPAPSPTQAGKEAGAVPPATAAPADAEPMPASVTAGTVVTTEAADPSAAFMAKVAALDHGAKPATAPQGPASAPGPASNADATQAKIAQAFAGQGSGDAGADPDSRGNGNGAAQGKAAQGVAQPSATAGADPAAAPLPTAQMVPTSGSAASFAAALADGGRLARYVTSAASAAAAGAPVGTIPVQSLSIQLQPVELGMVTANLKYAGNQLSIDIEVQTQDAQRRLSSDSSDIVKSLQSLGFQVDKVTVRQVQPQAQAQSQGQPQGQPTARDGSAGGFGAQGGNPFSAPGHSERQAGQHRQGSESGYEDTSERGVGMVQTASDRQPRRGVFI